MNCKSIAQGNVSKEVRKCSYSKPSPPPLSDFICEAINLAAHQNTWALTGSLKGQGKGMKAWGCSRVSSTRKRPAVKPPARLLIILHQASDSTDPFSGCLCFSLGKDVTHLARIPTQEEHIQWFTYSIGSWSIKPSIILFQNKGTKKTNLKVHKDNI